MEGGDRSGGSVRTRRRTRGLRAGIAAVAVGGLVWFVVAEWDQVTDAADLLVTADPGWIAFGSATSILSIVLFAAVRSVLVGACGAHFGLGRATGASFASGAIAATLPAGGAIATGYMVQRYREAGADGGAAAWTTIATGVVAPAALVFMTLSGYAWAGEDPTVALVPATVAATLLVAFFVIARHPGLLRAPARAVVLVWSRALTWLRRPARMSERPSTRDRSSRSVAGSDVGPRMERDRAADRAADRFVASFGAVRAGPGRWSTAWALQVLSWLGEFASLVAAVAAMGGSIPSGAAAWGSLLAVYGTAQLAGAVPVIPGGAGQVEAALVFGLTATGTDASTALAASVAFRLMSHWLVVPIGWVCVAVLRRRGADVPRRPTPV